MPSRRHSSAIFSSPRRPSKTIRTFSSAEYFLRVRRRISRTVASTPAVVSSLIVYSLVSSILTRKSHLSFLPYCVSQVLTRNNNAGAHGSYTFQYVSVYSPTSQGLFTAGQHFSSPAGAFSQNPSLTGNVTFGLAYKYQGTMPTGNRQFTMNFKAANLTFNATSVSSLVVANNVATLTGIGTINSSGNYNFLVTGVNGGGIRIQITDPSNNNHVIYDTQLGAAVTDTPTTSVNGQVIAHN